MAPQNLCRFVTSSGNLCKCYKLKGGEYCKAHNNYDLGSIIEYETDEEDDDFWNAEDYKLQFNKMIDFEHDLQMVQQTIVNLELSLEEMNKKLIDTQHKQQQYEKNQKNITIIQLFTCLCFLFALMYNNLEFKEVCLAAYQLIADISCNVDIYMTYSIGVIKYAQSFIREYSMFNQNYKICFN